MNELLAQSPCAKVTRCAGGHLHLTVGPVTICMEPDVFRAVVLTMKEASARLEDRGAPLQLSAQVRQ